MRAIRTLVLLATLAAVLAADASAFNVKLEPLPNGVVGQSYLFYFKIDGDDKPASPYWRTLNGNLPPGLTLSTDDGRLFGTPTTVGTWTFDVQVCTSTSMTFCSERKFTLSVVQGLAITTTTVPDGAVGVSYSVQLAAAGPGTYSWSTAGGTLPPGLTLSASGLLSGVPTTVGTYTFKAKVSAGTLSSTRDFTVKVVQPLVMTAPEIPPAVVGTEFSLVVQATGGTQPYTWSIKEGTWPKGLAFLNGVISGRPRVAGPYSFVVAVTDAGGITTVLPVALEIQPRLKVLVQTLPQAKLGKVYRGKVAIRGGAPPVQLEIDFGDLPPGLRLNAKTGALTGKPNRKGRFAFTVVATDQLGNSHRRSFVIRVR